MSQQLRAGIAGADHLSTVPRTSVRHLITSCNSSFRRPDTLLWPLLTHTQIHTQTHTYIHNSKFKTEWPGDKETIKVVTRKPTVKGKFEDKVVVRRPSSK